MLSRIADSMFWIGRYVERADQTGRILDVNLQTLTESPDDERLACRRLYRIFGLENLPETELTVQRVIERLVTDRTNPSSVAGALQAARENALSSREVLTTEVWESLNITTLGMPSTVQASRVHSMFQFAKDRCAVLNGLVDGAMTRDEAWLFLRVGQQLERVDMISRILQAQHLRHGSDSDTVLLLRTCSAHEAYIRSYRGQVNASDAIEFLLMDSFFPRSVAHCLAQCDDLLYSLAKLHGHAFDRMGTEDLARRMVGRAAASLRYRSLDEVLEDFENEMEQLQVLTGAVTRALGSTYFQPAAD